MTHRRSPRPKREGKHWTQKEIVEVRKLARGNTPTPLIADKMGRTEAAVYNKASEEDISLQPTNKTPYNRRKKKSR